LQLKHKDAAHATRHMIVVDMLRIGPVADRANATLAAN